MFRVRIRDSVCVYEVYGIVHVPPATLVFVVWDSFKREWRYIDIRETTLVED